MANSMRSFILPVLLLLSLSGCAAAVGAGAGVGVAAVQERGIKGRALDLKLQALILKDFVNADLKMTAAIGVEVYEGRVLLTGATTDVNIADRAAKIAWQTDGVQDVINEIQVGQSTDAGDYAKDALITGQLKSKITFDQDILAVNYSIETVNRTIYLIGIAQDEAELNRVRAHAESIKFVRKVVSHVRIKPPPFT